MVPATVGLHFGGVDFASASPRRNHGSMSPEDSNLYAQFEERLRFETLIADLSSRFINLPASEVDGEIMNAQRRICELLDLDVSGLWQWSNEAPGSLVLTHLYGTVDAPLPERMDAADYFPWHQKQMLAGRVVAFSTLEELPAEAARDGEVYRHFGIKSNVTIPLSVGGERPIGALGFNTTRAERDWPDVLVNRLQLVAQIFTNALARERADQTLRASEARLAAGVDLAGLGYYEVDYGERTCFLDNRFRHICGVPTGFLQHSFKSFEFWLEHVHHDDRQLLLEEREKLHDRRVDRISIEYRYLHPTDGQKWIYHLARIAGNGVKGAGVRTFGVIRDITAQKEAEREARELRDNLAHLTRVGTLGALSGSLAHELNQPLGIILSNAQAAQELLLQNPPDVAEVQAILADIVAADRRAGEVIERLRAMLKGGQASLQPLQLNQVIEEVLHLMRADLIGRGVTVFRGLAPDLPLVAGDRVQLQQLVLNLVLNAAEAMAANAPDARRLHLQTKLHQGRARVSVQDEGGGLPAEVERLFQPFYTTKAQGLGMGLAICRSIVAAHGGRIWAEPHSERSAVFHVELPVADSPTEP
jgi:signal transduction histidine kinase